MLVLTRSKKHKIVRIVVPASDQPTAIELKVESLPGRQVKVAFQAAKEVRVVRGELKDEEAAT